MSLPRSLFDRLPSTRRSFGAEARAGAVVHTVTEAQMVGRVTPYVERFAIGGSAGSSRRHCLRGTLNHKRRHSAPRTGVCHVNHRRTASSCSGSRGRCELFYRAMPATDVPAKNWGAGGVSVEPHGVVESEGAESCGVDRVVVDCFVGLAEDHEADRHGGRARSRCRSSTAVRLRCEPGAEILSGANH